MARASAGTAEARAVMGRAATTARAVVVCGGKGESHGEGGGGEGGGEGEAMVARAAAEGRVEQERV